MSATYVGLGTVIPKEVLLIVVSLIFFRVFHLVGSILVGVSFAGFIVPLLGSEWNILTVLVALVSVGCGAAIARSISEESPWLYFILLTVGLALLVLNWDAFIELLSWRIVHHLPWNDIPSISPF